MKIKFILTGFNNLNPFLHVYFNNLNETLKSNKYLDFTFGQHVRKDPSLITGLGMIYPQDEFKDDSFFE
jgi:hypothetical protein